MFMFTENEKKRNKKNYLKEITEHHSEKDHDNISTNSVNGVNRKTKYSDKELM